jgi:small ligand-binding sensory domain FIST
MSVSTLERFEQLALAPSARAAVLRADLEELMLRKREELRTNANPVLVVFIVSIAVLLALAAILSVAVLIFCATKGMNFEWYVKTSWFTVKVACSK